MRFYRVTGGNGYCGCDFEDYLALEEDESIDEFAYQMAMDNAESYAHVAFGWESVPDYDDEEYQFYLENVDYSYEEITEEEYLENR